MDPLKVISTELFLNRELRDQIKVHVDGKHKPTKCCLDKRKSVCHCCLCLNAEKMQKRLSLGISCESDDIYHASVEKPDSSHDKLQ